MLLVIKFLHLSPQNYKILHGFSNYFTKKKRKYTFYVLQLQYYCIYLRYKNKQY